MGQKNIPNNLRLNKLKNWHSKWMVEKKEYPQFLHFDLEIRKYFLTLFNYKKFKIIKLNIIKYSKNIHVYIYISKPNSYPLCYQKIRNHLNSYYINHNIKLFIKYIPGSDIKRIRYHIRRLFFNFQSKKKNNIYTRKLIYNCIYAFYTKNMQMISTTIQQEFEKKKSQKKQIRTVVNILQEFFKLFSSFIGYRLQIKGRFNNSKRKRKAMYQKGKIPLNTLDATIHYHCNEFKTRSGMCSIKLWIFFKFIKKKKRKKKRNVISKTNKIQKTI